MDALGAIKILRDYIGIGPEAEPVEFDKAVALGAEALEFIEENRVGMAGHVPARLPSESVT